VVSIARWVTGRLTGLALAFDNVVMSEPGVVPDLYCPNCARPVNDPLVCGDCRAVICRVCGTPLERADELGMG
jgi:hypothetical protein